MDSESSDDAMVGEKDSPSAVAHEPDWAAIEREEARRARLPIYIAIGVAALLLLPMAAFGVLGLAALGFSMMRSALVHRGEGWMFGAGLGTFFMAISVPVLLFMVVSRFFG
ncbi:hypothetical protein [Lacipirellula parvula]|uniref:Uncharacterized protein n=1 Tax=Lacipirellula parvula TaxID=2650471 RepID=A0A5K7X388_9BACT|nr:hypothetical protein [Lacipirellula parvula]BBO30825.1 hypothetical protein PLANPX_0437 [Lacipirellula parvula]